MTDTLTAKDIASKRKVSAERARQITRQLGKKNANGIWEVSVADYDKWASTARRPGPKKGSGARKAKSKKSAVAPVQTSSAAAQLNGSAALVLDVLSDRSLDDKTARFMAKYLIQKA